MILGPKEVMKAVILDAKTMSVRQIAKKYKLAHHATVHNWLQGKTISVQMLEHMSKQILKTKGN